MLADFFSRMLLASSVFKDKVALVIQNNAYTYFELYTRARTLSRAFLNQKIKTNNSLCVILSQKKLDFYAGFLACFFSNKTYTPLNIDNIEKGKQMLSMIDPSLIFVGEIAVDCLMTFLEGLSPTTLLFSDKNLYQNVKRKFKNHFLFCVDDLIFTNEITNTRNSAYLFFTSGSTGMPKAVPISHKNLNAYMKSLLSAYTFSSDDHFMQLSDIAFDISIHEILACFSIGGTLHVYDEHIEMSVAHFIVKHKITQCILVPSSIPVIIEHCQFFKCVLSSLKLTFVGGEPFPLSYAKQWHAIAPNSLIVNAYGPTEATVFCAMHTFDPAQNYRNLSTVPIGHPLSHVELQLTEKNELVILGDQVSSGYLPLQLDKKTRDKFQFDDITQKMAYFTGDRVTFNEAVGYIFHGRMDDQWQIKGYRLEKNEIESVLRKVFDVADIYVTPKIQHDLVHSVCAFSTHKINNIDFKKQLARFLPEPAIPAEIICLPEIPRLTNGKINYKALMQLQEKMI